MKNDPQTSIFRQESLERLSSPEQLDQLMQIVHSRSWLSLAALGSLVGLAVVWSIWGRIPIMVTGRGVLVHPTTTSTELVGVAYFERGEGDRIQPGMEIMIIPDVVGAEQTSGILGRVKAVMASPVTTLDAARQVNTASLQQDSVEVLIELEHDPSMMNDRWSSMAGQEIQLSPGMTTTAHVTLEHKAPIAFAFPFLEAAQ
ncbi:MAG: hypothetical protein SFY66_09420 [Oculatellaceae cyanobacterium bins.114]|nr:hypothetical protein [Oculatellaceae cyanobacterium bins.114]